MNLDNLSLEQISMINNNLDQLTNLASSSEQDELLHPFLRDLMTFAVNIQYHISPEEMRGSLKKLSEASNHQSLFVMALQSVLCAALSTHGMHREAIEKLL